MWMNNGIPRISFQKKVVVCLPWNANSGRVKLTAVALIWASIDQISFVFSILIHLMIIYMHDLRYIYRDCLSRLWN